MEKTAAKRTSNISCGRCTNACLSAREGLIQFMFRQNLLHLPIFWTIYCKLLICQCTESTERGTLLSYLKPC